MSDLQATARRIHGPLLEPGEAELQRIAAYCAENEIAPDVYGQGEALESFEDRVAALLGYPAARFMPTGTMAQPIAARIWSERSGVKLIGMHPTCHLELHEERGYQRLHGLSAVMVGEPSRPMSASDLAGSAEHMSTLIVELPTRENGGQLTDWDDLVALVDIARDRGIATHLDGARLWEAAAGYQRSLSEICELFDSAYVSFYKGIGALPGSMLCGPRDFIDEAVVWQRRQGGNPYSQLANWVSAAMRLDTQIAKMPAFCERARELAGALGQIDGITINPLVPHTNMFHVFLRGTEAELLAARDQVAEQHDIWFFGGLQDTGVPGTHKFELAIADAAMALTTSEIVQAATALVDEAQES